MNESKDEKEESSEPFAGYDAPKAEKGGGDPLKKKEPRRRPSLLIAVTAVASAVATVASVLTVFAPLSIVPLVLAAFCFFLVHIKCGLPFGVIAAAVTVLMTFLCGGLSLSFVLLCVCFFPYSLIALPLRRFDYFKIKGALLRGGIITAFINLSFFAVYMIAVNTVLGGLDVLAVVGSLGYALAAVIVSVVAVLTDFLFVLCDKVITPKIK